VMFGYFAAILVGHAVVLFLLCNPSEVLLVQILRPVFLLTSFLFNLSWLGVLCHGPGWAPQVSSEEVTAAARLPPPLATALEVGRLGSKQYLNADVITCSKCDSRKSPLEHHCSTCNWCVMWMDHHCNFCGICIGFRNMRCFIVWLSYGIALAWILNILTLHKLYQDGLPQSWRWCLWVPWCHFLVLLFLKLNYTLQFCVVQIAAGFHSNVMIHKFRGVLRDGMTLNEKMQACVAALPMAAPGSEERSLHEARLRVADTELAVAVQRLRTGIKHGREELPWGPFLGDGFWPNLAIIFGSQLSWRWLLPFVPGGTTTHFRWSPKGCEAWTELGAARERCLEALKEDKAASGAMQFQVAAFLNGHNAYCA